MGQEVVDYLEDNENKTAGVVLHSGEKLQADLVVVADGVKSGGRKYVLVNLFTIHVPRRIA